MRRDRRDVGGGGHRRGDAARLHRRSATCHSRSPRAGWLAVRGALAYVDDAGTLTRTSAGTVLQLIPFGYSVIRDDRLQLWGQGLSLHAVAAALEAGP